VWGDGSEIIAQTAHLGSLKAHIVPIIHNPLVGVNQIVDMGYKVTFSSDEAIISNNANSSSGEQLIIPRASDGLW
jgi:hypothetical protein